MNRLLKSWKTWLPVPLTVIYMLTIYALGGLRSDHWMMCSAMLALYYVGPQTRRVFKFLSPIVLTLIIYDSMRFYADYIRGPVHVKEPYYFDKIVFGIVSQEGLVQTPNEWWQLHTHPILDFITGILYIGFIWIFVLQCAYFFFWVTRKGTKKRSAEYVRFFAPNILWSFFWTNMIGYSTYYWYAAAPPWYVALHGLGPAKMDTPPNPAGAVRFDALFGTSFFTGFYSRSADVFGAIPSLHVSYPLIALYYAYKFGAGTVFSLLFYLGMCFSAVYLNHHYVLDLIVGSIYAIAVSMIVDKWSARRFSTSPEPSSRRRLRSVR